MSDAVLRKIKFPTVAKKEVFFYFMPITDSSISRLASETSLFHGVYSIEEVPWKKI